MTKWSTHPQQRKWQEEMIANGWLQHDGGECPVPPDTRVALPGDTYARDPSNLRAGDLEWRDRHNPNLRDEIEFYKIVETAPTERS